MKKERWVKYTIPIFSQVVLLTIPLKEKKSANISTHSYTFIKKKYYTLLFKVRKLFISPRLLFPAGEKKNAACVKQIISTSLLSKYQHHQRCLWTKFAIIQREYKTWSVLILFVSLQQHEMKVQKPTVVSLYNSQPLMLRS